MEKLTPAQKELYDWLAEYIKTANHAPTLRQMMSAMNLRSLAPIQSRLANLRKKGYIDWGYKQAITIKILHQPEAGLLIKGVITPDGLVQGFDEKARLDLPGLHARSDCYVLRMAGDSMIEDLINEGDYLIMRSLFEGKPVKNGDIVAATVLGYGTTVRSFYQDQDIITLKAGNQKYKPFTVAAAKVRIKSVLAGVWRSNIAF